MTTTMTITMTDAEAGHGGGETCAPAPSPAEDAPEVSTKRPPWTSRFKARRSKREASLVEAMAHVQDHLYPGLIAR